MNGCLEFTGDKIESAPAEDVLSIAENLELGALGEGGKVDLALKYLPAVLSAFGADSEVDSGADHVVPEH